MTNVELCDHHWFEIDRQKKSNITSNQINFEMIYFCAKCEMAKRCYIDFEQEQLQETT